MDVARLVGLVTVAMKKNILLINYRRIVYKLATINLIYEAKINLTPNNIQLNKIIIIK